VIVRRLGYQAHTSISAVRSGDTTALVIALAPAATRLTEIVTTAAGRQRRVEVGNVIAHIDVDSIAPTAPVTSLTDLLSARASGVQVVESNGLVGSGPAIRIRGQSSLVLSSDPILIVDGVRQDNRAGGTYNPRNGGQPSPSRINDLDFSQIATIDVLKGPAASARYGTDAANGVIIITTKRGQPGQTQWHASSERGWSEVPTGFPDFYYGWGHTTDGTNTEVPCPLAKTWSFGTGVTDGTCTVDSVTHANPLNHHATTIYGTGLRQKSELQVSGGAGTIRYYLAGGQSRDVGIVHLPDVFRPQALAMGFPKSVFDPNTQLQRSARTNLSATVGPAIDVSVLGAYLKTVQREPGGSDFAQPGQNGPVALDSLHNYGYGYPTDRYTNPLNSLGTSQGETTTRTTAGLTADWRPATWFVAHAAAGLDHGSQQSQGVWLPQAHLVATGQDDGGEIVVTNTTTDVSSGEIRGSLMTPLTSSVRATTSVGVQLARTEARGVTATAVGLSEANLTLNGAPYQAISQSGDGHATVGRYIEEQVNVADRLFATGALRVDQASGFGGDYHTTIYPNLSASWLALNTGTTTLRFRSAFGIAGQQPDNGAALQLYKAQAAYLDGAQIGSAVLNAPGNPNLRPERSREFEGGFDLGLWNDRVNLEMTAYRKNTKDALVNVSLGWTLNNATFQENLGDVKNSGTELTLQATLVDTKSAIWSVTVNS
jgi:TonB-dependent SusC/RagA subfamily outer membrane receptor